MSTPAERAEMIKIMTENGNYSKWEMDFLESITAQLERGNTLSPAQEDKLLQIQRKD